MGKDPFDFEKLDAFGVAVDIVAAVDVIADALPPGRAYIRDQLQRAANSIVLNLAEGAGEFAPLEKARFYRMAKRSATETAAQVLVCRRLHLVSDENASPAVDLLRREVGVLTALAQASARRGAQGIDTDPRA